MIFFIKFIGFFSGCFVCCYLQRSFGLGAVAAAASVGFFGTFCHFTKRVEKSGIHAVIYAGSFAGMCSAENLPDSQHIFIISLIGTTLYLLAKPHLVGFGGKLGTIAFISSLVIILSRSLW